MPAAAQSLLHLQSLDDQLTSNRQRLEDIESRLRPDMETREAERRVGELSAHLDAARLELRRLEAEAEDLAATVTRLTNTLYGGSIHDARELRSLEAEIAHARDRHTACENRELTVMERVEALENEVVTARGDLVRRSQRREELVKELRLERPAIEAALSDLEARRGEAAAAIEPSRLEQYTRLRARLGHAVSVVENGVCHWCRVQIPAKDVQHARGSAIVTCTNCSRILFAE